MLDTFRYGALGFPSSLGSMLDTHQRALEPGLRNGFDSILTSKFRWLWNGWSWIGLFGCEKLPRCQESTGKCWLQNYTRLEDAYNVSKKHKEGRWVWVTPRSQDKCDFQHQLFEPWRSLLEIRHFPVTSRSYCIAGATPKGAWRLKKNGRVPSYHKMKMSQSQTKTTLSLH